MSAVYRSADGQKAVETRYAQILEAWPVAHEHMRVPTRVGETFVIASGPKDAPPLFLHHGSGFNSVGWMSDIGDWSRDFRVYAVDMIGEPGFSAAIRPAYGDAAYISWLDDLLLHLGVESAGFVGTSLGGWLAMRYAAARPHRALAIAVMCPGGVGREKIGLLTLLFVILPLSLMGRWRSAHVQRMLLGRGLEAKDEHYAAASDFLSLIIKHFKHRPKLGKAGTLSDAELRALTMPVLLIAGADDAMIDMHETRERMENHVKNLDVLWLAETGHFIPPQTQAIGAFLRKALAPDQPTG